MLHEAKTGVVRFTKAERGFGFIAVPGEKHDVFFHRSDLEAAGVDHMVKPGTTIKCTIKPVQEGLAADRIIDVEEPATQNARTLEPGGEWADTFVKWFDAERLGYGFLILRNRNEDVFIHITTVRSCGFETISKNEELKARIKKTPKGLMALEIR